MSEPITLETLARRLDAVEARLAGEPAPVDRWLALGEFFDQSPDAVAFRQSLDKEVQKARDAERAELGLDQEAA